MATGGATFDKSIIYFGPWKLDVRETFYKTDHSIALVNTKPIVPGINKVVAVPEVLERTRDFVHSPFISFCIDPRVCNLVLADHITKDLTPAEVSDMWLTAQLVGKKVETHFEASSLTLAIQDGKEAGQTVPHVHIHILPRRKGDFEKNDEVYDAIDANSKENATARNAAGEPLNLDKERKARSIDEMAKEAAILSSLFYCG